MHVRRFKMVYIQPSRYDDDGYLYQYRLGLLPSNTMAILYGYTQRLFNSGVFGPDLEVTVEAYDEVVQRVPLSRIIRESRRPDTCLSVGLVGVMSSEFPRAMDLALQFREAGVPVLMGGIHISGMLKMFETPTGGLKTLIDSGATLIQGEVEDPGALESLLRDVLADTLQPIYRMPDCPDLRNAPVPEADPKYVRRFITRMLTLDTSRGCPFDCSFCCTTYLQGRTIRGRSAPAVLEAIEVNHDRGFHNYYFTDDNLARSPIWKELFDGLITLRDRGKSIRFLMMVDTQSWKIPQFVEKAAAAGCYQVFVGMESVNPENLTAVGKKQNRVDEYVEMVSCWRRNGILIHVGYIIGLPHDTLESVRRDIKLLRDKVLIDEASFAMLMPFPGSRDYLNLIRSCVPLDADFNNYDSLHETSRHPNFGPGEWTVAYNDAWSTFYEKKQFDRYLSPCTISKVLECLLAALVEKVCPGLRCLSRNIRFVSPEKPYRTPARLSRHGALGVYLAQD